MVQQTNIGCQTKREAGGSAQVFFSSPFALFFCVFFEIVYPRLFFPLLILKRSDR